jgi:hypothetical protein
MAPSPAVVFPGGEDWKKAMPRAREKDKLERPRPIRRVIRGLPWIVLVPIAVIAFEISNGLTLREAIQYVRDLPWFPAILVIVAVVWTADRQRMDQYKVESQIRALRRRLDEAVQRPTSDQ